jgi:hypothetical protein
MFLNNRNYRTHEDLEEKSHRQDRQIESLLNQFDTLRTDQMIKEWMDRAQSDGTRAEGRVSKLGRINLLCYFRPFGGW